MHEVDGIESSISETQKLPPPQANGLLRGLDAQVRTLKVAMQKARSGDPEFAVPTHIAVAATIRDAAEE
jgi:hypothetical protein